MVRKKTFSAGGGGKKFVNEERTGFSQRKGESIVVSGLAKGKGDIAEFPQIHEERRSPAQLPRVRGHAKTEQQRE